MRRRRATAGASRPKAGRWSAGEASAGAAAAELHCRCRWHSHFAAAGLRCGRRSWVPARSPAGPYGCSRLRGPSTLCSRRLCAWRHRCFLFHWGGAVELTWRLRLGQKGHAAELSGGVGGGVRMEGTTALLVVAADAFCCRSMWCRGGQGTAVWQRCSSGAALTTLLCNGNTPSSSPTTLLQACSVVGNQGRKGLGNYNKQENM
ncbi:hypothetical protein PVAP13_4NG113700 [Panicum virgatum]|uniref:Uncharacterized protein n=1 Tax=Panicum virgatum TaxID=38727 RepID=A0A8T0T9K7_PANVG|nr:hypothetical protein PVAP13_4NG113700 [Panicum virgatum]